MLGISGCSEYFGCQGDNLHIGGAQLAGYGAEDAGAAEFACVVEQYAGIVVKADVRAVGATDFLFGAHDNGLGYSAFLDVGAGDGSLDGDYDDVANLCVATAGATEHVDAQHFFGSAVVGNR